MHKQDKAFSSWLNHLLLPGAQGGAGGGADEDGAGALNDRRLAAVMRGALVKCYRCSPRRPRRRGRGEGGVVCRLAARPREQATASRVHN